MPWKEVDKELRSLILICPFALAWLAVNARCTHGHPSLSNNKGREFMYSGWGCFLSPSKPWKYICIYYLVLTQDVLYLGPWQIMYSQVQRTRLLWQVTEFFFLLGESWVHVSLYATVNIRGKNKTSDKHTDWALILSSH